MSDAQRKNPDDEGDETKIHNAELELAERNEVGEFFTLDHI